MKFIFRATAHFVLATLLVFQISAAVLTGDIAITNSAYDGQDIVVSNGTVTIDSARFYSLTLKAGSKLTSVFGGQASLIISNQCIIETGSSIDVSGKGIGFSAGGSSVGSFVVGGGGGHGGSGGQGFSNAPAGGIHGSVSMPENSGGTGGSGFEGVGGCGGAVIKLHVFGTLQNDGQILANGADGTNSRSGGGAGGSVWIVAQTLAGNGLISANGGNGEPALGGGGGGGRISIVASNQNFNGSISAIGGLGWESGGAGTILIETPASGSTFVLDNGGRSGGLTWFTNSAIQDLLVGHGATLRLGSSLAVTNLTVASGGTITGTNSIYVTLTVTDDAWVATNGSIDLDFLGYSGGSGTGGYQTGGYGSGGSHGGFGGVPPNYTGPVGSPGGSITTPVSLGSRGGGLLSSGTFSGGAGAGGIYLNVGGELRLDGIISANGGSAISGGGGSGGSVRLNAGVLRGTGAIRSRGGDGSFPRGGGGSGGRIAVRYGTNLFAGTIDASGGFGGAVGGAGTIYMASRNGETPTLLIDNSRNPGGKGFWGNIPVANLSIKGRTTLILPSDVTLASLHVEAGSRISGEPSVSSIGKGGIAIYDTAGGGNAGYGGASANGATGGVIVQNHTRPTLPGGSGGGTGPSAGAGGGAIHVTVNGELRVDGEINVDGRDGADAFGGGAGGSIWLTAQTLTGSGLISASGGNGYPDPRSQGGGALPYGGGGGGGCIGIECDTNLFTGNIEAFGGSGFENGGAGVVCLAGRGGLPRRFVVNNSGATGAHTLLNSIMASRLEASGGALAYAPGILDLTHLLVRSNSWLQSGTIVVRGDATIEEGGQINMDGITGGASAIAGGGANGGMGGGNLYVQNGSIHEPATSGNMGYSGSGSTHYPFGGRGGGVIRMAVSNMLHIDGVISANGLRGDPKSGGGAGGSVWLTTGTLTGSGLIAADGGDAGTGGSGGGGGGRIAIHFRTNDFAGRISARGGMGPQAGGAGTVFLNPLNGGTARLLIANDGISGAATVLSATDYHPLPTNTFGLTVVNGATASLAPGFPVLSDVTVAAGGIVTGSKTNLNLSAFGKIHVAEGGQINLDGKGYSGGSGGPGSGAVFLNTEGAGGGHGGAGGNSARGALGGSIYGSPVQPTSPGSSGGMTYAPFLAGSEGGGVIRLVAPSIQVDGRISTAGKAGFNDDSGGGAGGSIWITTTSLGGTGTIAAAGGNSESWRGGGGGGGRIAVYAVSNGFSGTATAIGGIGAMNGQNGTVEFFNSLLPFQVSAHSPTGIVSGFFASAEVRFNQPLALESFSSSNFSLVTPAGTVGPESLQVIMLTFDQARIHFPTQMLEGVYGLIVNTNVRSLLGETVSQSYNGLINVQFPVVSGRVTNLLGEAVSGISIQPNGLATNAVTDINGLYAIGIPSTWSGTIIPQSTNWFLLPRGRSYFKEPNPKPNQDFLAVTTLVPSMTFSLAGTNVLISWNGLPHVSYQLWTSIDLLNWNPSSFEVTGVNEPMVHARPIGAEPQRYFKLEVRH